MPIISIIVPVYNVSRYLPKCLDSILAQTIKDIEVICVNDGSTDNSLAILQQYEKRDQRIKVISQQNKGLGAARNTGMRAAKGSYIGFVDSDDFVSPDMYKSLYSRAITSKADVVISGVKLYYDDSGKTSSFRDMNWYKSLSKKKYLSLSECPKLLQVIGVWDKLYRKEFLIDNSIENPENRIYEDVLFTVKTMVLAKRISVSNGEFYFYRKNTGRSIVDKEAVNDSYKFDFLKNLKESKDFLLSNDSWNKFRTEFLEFQINSALYHHTNIQRLKTSWQFSQQLANILSFTDVGQLISKLRDSKRRSDKFKRLYLSLVCHHRCLLASILVRLLRQYYLLRCKYF